MNEYILDDIGVLKYSRIKSMSILRSELKSFDYDYSLQEIKILFDKLTFNDFEESFNEIYKRCFDLVFDNNKYLDITAEEFEHNFLNYIIPSAR